MTRTSINIAESEITSSYPSRGTAFLSILLALTATAVYLASRFNEFALDDLIHIIGDSNIRTLENGVAGAFGRTIFPGNLYRPLVTASYSLTYYFFELRPEAYHLTNVFLHAGVCVVLFQLLSRLFEKRLAFAAAFFFAVHPAHSEAVANISGRAELLAALFGLLSTRMSFELFAAKLRKRKVFLIGALGFILSLLAMFSKESAACFFLLACLINYFGPPASLKQKAAGPVIILSAVACYCGIRFFVLHGQLLGSGAVDFLDNPLVALPLHERISTAVLVLGKYFMLLLSPVDLGGDYSYAAMALPPAAPELFTYGLLLGGLAVLIISGLRRRSPASFFSIWFFLAFAVTSNILFPIGTIFGERLSYLPSVSAAGLIALGLERLPAAFFRILFGALITAFFVFQTLAHNGIWRNNDTLFAHQIKISPESAKAQVNYGIYLRNHGKLKEAENHMRRALNIYPPFDGAVYAMATVHLFSEDEAAGEVWLMRALALNPKHAPSLETLGRVYLNRRRYHDALGLFHRAHSASPADHRSLIGLLAVNIGLGRKEESVRLKKLLESRGETSAEFRKLAAMVDP